jgi:hypothetical protein
MLGADAESELEKLTASSNLRLVAIINCQPSSTMSHTEAIIAKSTARFDTVKLNVLAEASCLPGGGIAEKEEYEQWARRFLNHWVSDRDRSRMIAVC